MTPVAHCVSHRSPSLIGVTVLILFFLPSSVHRYHFSELGCHPSPCFGLRLLYGLSCSPTYVFDHLLTPLLKLICLPSENSSVALFMAHPLLLYFQETLRRHCCSYCLIKRIWPRLKNPFPYSWVLTCI